MDCPIYEEELNCRDCGYLRYCQNCPLEIKNQEAPICNSCIYKKLAIDEIGGEQ